MRKRGNTRGEREETSMRKTAEREGRERIQGGEREEKEMRKRRKGEGNEGQQ